MHDQMHVVSIKLSALENIGLDFVEEIQTKEKIIISMTRITLQVYQDQHGTAISN